MGQLTISNCWMTQSWCWYHCNIVKWACCHVIGSYAEWTGETRVSQHHPAQGSLTLEQLTQGAPSFWSGKRPSIIARAWKHYIHTWMAELLAKVSKAKAVRPKIKAKSGSLDFQTSLGLGRKYDPNGWWYDGMLYPHVFLRGRDQFSLAWKLAEIWVRRNLSDRRKNNFLNRENFHQVKTQFHEHFMGANFLPVERKFLPNFSSSPTHLKMRFLSTFAHIFQS